MNVCDMVRDSISSSAMSMKVLIIRYEMKPAAASLCYETKLTARDYRL